jgi:hypothetical protein
MGGEFAERLTPRIYRADMLEGALSVPSLIKTGWLKL